MEILDWVAILGALAWSPHLATFIKSHLTKPEVRIISQKVAEIGFTSYGPIFNIRLAFSVKYHDIVLSNFKIKVTHESGEERTFEWQNLKQQVMKLQTNEGPIPYEKENSVLALKLNQRDIEERFIQCQEVSFISGKRELENVAIKRLSFERDQAGYDPMTFLQCQECRDVYNYIKHAFSWKAGQYSVEYQLESPEKFKLLDNKYEFTLLPIDVEQLERNKDQIEQEYINSFTNENHEMRRKVHWNWRAPSISKRN